MFEWGSRGAGDRGVSHVLGVVLLASVVIVGAVLIVQVGQQTIGDVNDDANVEKLYRAGADYVQSLATVSGRMLTSTVFEDEEVLAYDKRINVVRLPAGSLAGSTTNSTSRGGKRRPTRRWSVFLDDSRLTRAPDSPRDARRASGLEPRVRLPPLPVSAAYRSRNARGSRPSASMTADGRVSFPPQGVSCDKPGCAWRLPTDVP